jgi:hypothetical protein
MPKAGFEPAITASERSKTLHTSYRYIYIYIYSADLISVIYFCLFFCSLPLVSGIAFQGIRTVKLLFNQSPAFTAIKEALMLEICRILRFSRFEFCWAKWKLKLRVARGWGSHIFRHSAYSWRWGCQPYAPAAFYSQEDSWYSFLLEAESTPRP